MDPITNRLHRLSPNQLRVLRLLAKSQNGIISSGRSGSIMGIKGKALGGLFSSLSRQKIAGERLVMPWGKSEDGRGLRWKLNEKLISQKELLAVVDKILEFY